MKVLFLLHLPPPVHGSSIIGLNIKKSKIINETFECSYINLLASQNVAESGKVNTRKLVGFIFIFFKVFKTIILQRPIACYLALTSTGAAFYRDVSLVMLLRLFRIKRVYHLHNKGVNLHQHKRFNRFWYQFVFRNADVIILSKHLYSDIQNFVPENRVHICPNGIEERQESDLRNKKPDNKAQILFLSNLIRSKGVFVLLEALSLLNKKGLIFEGVFIGNEGDITVVDFIEQVGRLELVNNVSYLGGKYGEEKIAAFRDADIFIHPTYSDCFPLVIMEAMQHSLPVISTYEGGIPDIVEYGITGFLVQQQNVELLAEKIELLIANPELRIQMGNAGRIKFENSYTLQHFEKRLMETLSDIINKNKIY